MEKQLERQLMAQIINSIQESPKKVKEKPKPKRTISSILWRKYLDKIEKEGVNPIFMLIFKIFLLILTISWLIHPETVASLFFSGLRWHNYLLPKILACSLLIFNLEIFLRVSYYLAVILGKILTYLVKKKPKTKNKVDCINGIPHNELITHLLEVGSFKRADIEKKFAIPRRKYEGLAKALEILGIIQKDKSKNNTFVFIQEFTRQDLANILDGKNDDKDLIGFAKRIKKTVHLSPTPNFTNEKINC